jgi:hypothetical protein
MNSNLKLTILSHARSNLDSCNSCPRLFAKSHWLSRLTGNIQSTLTHTVSCQLSFSFDWTTSLRPSLVPRLFLERATLSLVPIGFLVRLITASSAGPHCVMGRPHTIWRGRAESCKNNGAGVTSANKFIHNLENKRDINKRRDWLVN